MTREDQGCGIAIAVTPPRRAAPARKPRGARLGVARTLGVLLVLTGCAVEPTHPPEHAAPGPGAPALLVPPPVLSRFGEPRGTGGSRAWPHAGLDFRAVTGTPVLAASGGVVLRTGTQTLAGKLVVIDHGDDLSTVYYHLAEVLVRPGQGLRRGDVIGRVGATGNATTPHLHFGVCRGPGGACDERTTSGWQDPARHWIDGDPCFVAGRPYPADSGRLTYPLPCALAAASG